MSFMVFSIRVTRQSRDYWEPVPRHIIGNRYYGLCFSLMQIETAVPNTMAEAFATVHGQPDTYGCCVCIMQ